MNRALSNNSNWKGGRIIDGGYMYIYSPNHPRAIKRKYIAEHVLIMEAHLGRFLTSNEVVHHRDGNPQNNYIENLELHTRSTHATYHGTGKELFEHICAYCEKVFQRDKRTKPKGVRPFCSRSCAAKYHHLVATES